MSWFLLTLAGLFEIGWAIGLKYSDGFTRPVPSVLTVLSMIASIWLLALAMRQLPLGTAYAVWTGIGTVGTAIIGMAVLGEPRHITKILCIALIVVGIVGLKVFTSPPAPSPGQSQAP